MSKAIPYISCLIVGAVICFVVFRSCERSSVGPDHSLDKKFVDSVVAINRDSIQRFFQQKEAKANDSMNRLTDSFETIVRSDRYTGIVKENEISGLTATISNLQKKKDTAGELKACDSLKNAADQGLALVKKTMKDRDDLDSSYKVQISLRQDANIRLSNMFAESNRQLFSIGLRYDSLYNDYKKVNKKITHWSIGPGIGGTIVNGKAQPVIDVSIHYDLFKF